MNYFEKYKYMNCMNYDEKKRIQNLLVNIIKNLFI